MGQQESGKHEVGNPKLKVCREPPPSAKRRIGVTFTDRDPSVLLNQTVYFPATNSHGGGGDMDAETS